MEVLEDNQEIFINPALTIYKKISFAKLAKESLDETERIIRVYGPRLAGSESSKAVAHEIADNLQGFCDHVRVEEFVAHPDLFYSYTMLLPIAYFLGIYSLFICHGLYILPIISILFGVARMFSQFWFYGRLGDDLFPSKSCFNVEGIIEPENDAEVELIISGHHDSAPIARIFSGPFERFYAIAILAPYTFSLFELGILLALLFDWIENLPIVIVLVVLLGIPFVIGYFFMVDTRKGSPGAGDNLIASMLITRIARELVKHKKLFLHRTRVRVISFDAEEAGLCDLTPIFSPAGELV